MLEPFIMAGVGHLSDTGNLRRDEPNQDGYRLPANATPTQLKQKGWLFVVADGVGMNEGDARGSQIAVNLIQQAYYHDRSTAIAASLKHAFETANQTIFNKSGILFNELSTSVVCAVVLDRTLHVAHVGDSRAYLIGPDGIRLLTTDHAVVTEPNPEETESTESLESQPQKLLMRSVGSTPTVEPEYNTCELQPDERILLCTQGLYNVVADAELQAIVAQQAPAAAVQQLITVATEREGSENITAVVIEPSALLAPAFAAPVEPGANKTVSLAVTGIVGIIVLVLVFAARGIMVRASTPGLAAGLESVTPIQGPITATALIASPTMAATDTPIPTATARSTATQTPTATETQTPIPTISTVEEDTPEPPTPTRAPPPTSSPRPTATTPPTPTALPPPAVQPRYPAVKLREPQFNQDVTGSSLILEWEVQTLLPGDKYEVYYKRMVSQTWEGKCAPINNGRCVLTFDRVQGFGSYDWTVVIVDSTGFIVSRLRDVSRFVWTTTPPEPTSKPGCVPIPPNRC